jgi:hypothetical protein
MKKILIYSLNSYISEAVLHNLLIKLSKDYNIIFVTSDDGLSPRVKKYFLNLKKEKIIYNLFIIPNFWTNITFLNFFISHKFYLKVIKFLKNINFDIVLMCYGNFTVDRIFLEAFKSHKKLTNYYPYHSTRPLIYSDYLTNYFLKKKNSYFNLNSKNKILNKRKKFVFNKIKILFFNFRLKFFFVSIYKRLTDNFFIGLFSKIIFFSLYKYFPKKFKYQEYNFSNNKFVNTICCSELIYNFGKRLYSNQKFYLTNPVYASYSKKSPSKKDILLIMGWYANENVVNEAILKDLLILKNNINFNYIHIKPHPSFLDQNYNDLNILLLKNDINNKILKEKDCLPMRIIIKDYQGVIGFASHSLVEARYLDRKKFVLCLSHSDMSSNKFINYGSKAALGQLRKKNNFIDFLDKEEFPDRNIFSKKYRILNKFPSDYKIINKIINQK